MYLWPCNLAHWVKEHYFAAVKIPSHVIMSCVTQTKNFTTLWTRQAVIETAFKIIAFLASVGHPDMWTSGSKISVQPHIFIMHVVISDTYMHNKSMGCAEIILKDPGQRVGARESLNGQNKSGAKNYLSLRHLYRCLDFPLPPLPARESPRIYDNLI